MKVLLDTNVLVSAALKDRDPEAVILAVVERPDCEWIASAAILEEYRAVLARPKFRLPADVLDQWARLLGTLITIVEVNFPFEFSRDPGDAKFLACALASGADDFVTGDRDFEDAQALVAPTVIVSVATFKALLDGLAFK